MIDTVLAKEIVSLCFWFTTGVAFLCILEIVCGEFVRERVRHLFKRDDT